MPRAAALALLFLALASASGAALGCGGGTFDGTVYRGEGGVAFRVPTPPTTWQRIESDRTSLAFRDPNGDATVAVSGRCGVDGEDVPLAALTQHLFIRFTERTILTEEVVPFDAREAMHSEVLAKLDGVPKRFDVWVLKKDGCVYDLYYIARPDRFEAGIEAFRRFVHGFGTVTNNDD